MLPRMQFHAVFFVATLALSLANQNFLQEKPSFLRTCKRADANFNKCFANIYNVIFKEWKDGIPGLESVGSADPLYIDRISISQGDNNPLISMNVDLLNVKLTGISQVEIKDINLDDKLVVTSKIRAPKLKIESDYNVKGSLLNLPVDTNGQAVIDISDFNMNIQMHLKLRDEYGHIFTDVDKLEVEISNIGGLYIDLKNLFNGQTVLEQSTNFAINQNWRDFYDVLGPAIKTAIQDIMYDRFKKIYAFVPATYFIEDLPTAAEYYG